MGPWLSWIYWRWGQSSANSSLLRLFPVLLENTGKFVEFSLKKTIIRRVRSVNSMAYQQISLSVKTGKIFGLSGNKN
jgi:hypothetical protein